MGEEEDPIYCVILKPVVLAWVLTITGAIAAVAPVSVAIASVCTIGVICLLSANKK